MKVRRRIRRSTRQYITVALICVIVIGGAAIFTSLILTDQIRQEYEHKLEEANLERTKNQRSVYTALSDIKIGEILSIENVKKMIVYGSQPEETYAGEEEIGKAVLLDIPAGTQIQKNMLTQNMIDSEMREVEYNVILINSNLINNDYIDIRIMFPNGEDYIVLSKKMMKYMSPEIDSCFLWLSEEEILRMASAIVDAYLYQGTKLYTTKYIEPNIQSSSIITYEPSLSTLLLIKDNPNILETATTELSKQVRKAMENRLAASFSTNVEEIDWKLNTNAIIESDDIPAVLDPANSMKNVATASWQLESDYIYTEEESEVLDDSSLGSSNNDTKENQSIEKANVDDTNLNTKEQSESLRNDETDINKDIKEIDGIDLGINNSIDSNSDEDFLEEYFMITEG